MTDRVPFSISPLFKFEQNPVLSPDLPEFSIYAFLKIGVYERALHAGQGPDRPLVPAFQAYLERFSSRRLHTLMIAGSTDGKLHNTQFTDFFDISSYFVRERMKNLNHGTVLQSKGRGLRGAVTYRWKEPLDASTFSSFLQLRATLDTRLPYAVDLWRIAEEFTEGSFTQDEFVRLFRRHRDNFVSRRWYELVTRSASGSPEYTRFLLARLEGLAADGFIAKDGEGWRLTEKGKQASHWFELFVYSAAYRNAPAAPAGGPANA